MKYSGTNSNSSIGKKNNITTGFFSLFFIIAIIQLINIQIVKHDDYVVSANSQYVKNLEDNFNRGKIFFSKLKSENILVAGIKDDIKIKNEKEYIIKNRVYPLDDIGAKVLGFVAYDENKRVGRYGIEKYYDDVLSRDSDKLYTNFFAEIFGDIKGAITSDKPFYEGDLNLTIDVEAQKYLYETLKETKEKWKSEKIGGIIMNPKDGRIIAMEELPSYNPNKFSAVKDASYYKNDLVSGVYEMGSIIKPLTMGAALDSGTVDENTFYNDVGSRELNGRNVSNFDKQGKVLVFLFYDVHILCVRFVFCVYAFVQIRGQR
jgi:cell division protein FtsI/penicillin-binding protein 2